MGLEELQNVRVRLPSGREARVADAISFCYDLSDTDISVLKELLQQGIKSEDELAEALKLSKASINRSVNKLTSLGFVERVKDPNSKGGRPRYLYKPMPMEQLLERMRRDFSYCAEIFSKAIISLT
ncbi:HTH-type transcriptional regulator Lrs14 [Sulfodiicoccus acidiphilus]|uniref:HTH-type transcriptional regulator Lrs14 n=1 Tax=Sulfodiicoccus acidiphilus TaxID=1670455 RepID=UPI001E30AA6A|nr:HTH-type transcriptional regulator Lrs14 [Sulfodiicoccus acidiphilus]